MGELGERDRAWKEGGDATERGTDTAETSWGRGCVLQGTTARMQMRCKISMQMRAAFLGLQFQF